MRNLLTLLFVVSVYLVQPTPAWAELVEIESLVRPVADEIAEQLEGQTVVVAARFVGKRAIYWNPHEAMATELTAALRERDIDAIRYATDHRIVSLGDKKKPFNSKDAEAIRIVERDVLLAANLTGGRKPELQLSLLSSETGKSLWEKKIPVPASALQLDKNIPELSKRVVAYCRKNKGKCVGKGECSTLAKFALKDAKAHQPGVYSWGRQLDEREPVIPGDILQFELAKLRAPGFKKNYTHHTAVVTDMNQQHIIVHHQNVGSKGKIVQQEQWPLNVKRTGIVAVYRPWSGNSPLPPLTPRRKEPPTIVRRGKTIDLLNTVEPRLDSVSGLWFREDNGLKWNRDTFARLQVPVTPSEEYVLRLKLRRLFGRDSFGIGLIVGGHQAHIAIDGYGGKISGLNLLDGKKCKDNETTYRKAVIPPNKLVTLEVYVGLDSIRLVADGQTIIDWEGDPSRLSIQKEYSVPNSEWLFLTSWNTQFHLKQFILEEQ